MSSVDNDGGGGNPCGGVRLELEYDPDTKRYTARCAECVRRFRSDAQATPHEQRFGCVGHGDTALGWPRRNWRRALGSQWAPTLARECTLDEVAHRG